MKQTIARGFDALGVPYTQSMLNQLERYQELLLAWNEKINLTAITEPEEIAVKHFVDCAAVVEALPDDGAVIDVGTGAGFPGLVLKILQPERKICLLDSLNERIDFLKAVVQELGLEGVEFYHARAEDAGKDPAFREQFGVAVARAVANLSTLSEYCLPFVKPGGYFLSMKGPEVEEEIKAAQNALKKLGGEVERIKTVNLPETDIFHTIISVKKLRQTPPQYPRKAGKPAKEPLK